MSRRQRFSSAAYGASLLLLVGCGESDAGAAADGGARDAADANTACENPGTGFNGRLKLLELSGSYEEFAPIAGASVCIHERHDIACATTDAAGAYSLDCLPPGELPILFQHPDYASTMWLRVLTPGRTDTLDTVLIPDDTNLAYFATAGITYPDAGLGVITINETAHVDGATAIIETAGFRGPFYSGSGQLIDPQATGTVGDGLIHFVGPVGLALVRVTGPSGAACPQVSGQWTDSLGRLRIPVLENTETTILVRCP